MMTKRRFGSILLVIGLTGCIGGGAPAPHVRQYILEYPAPSVEKITGTDALQGGAFSVARALAGPAMLYRQGAFRRDAYHDRRWRVAPADMVTDFLQRDLMQAGLFFRAVLAARDPEDTRFVLTGWLEEFSEVDDGEHRKAVLAATVTFLDLSVREIPGRVVFRRTIAAKQPWRSRETRILPRR